MPNYSKVEAVRLTGDNQWHQIVVGSFSLKDVDPLADLPAATWVAVESHIPRRVIAQLSHIIAFRFEDDEVENVTTLKRSRMFREDDE